MRHTSPVFLVGVPKSGTTILQRILSSHSKISSSEEPWIMLPLVYALREHGHFSEYGALSCYASLIQLLNQLPNGESDYWAACREFSNSLYGALSSENAVYFLDKTPRYHLILNELARIHPNAKFIFIWRHPLDVMSSLLSHTGGKIRGLRFGQNDIVEGPKNIVRFRKKGEINTFSLSYEDLARDPDLTLGRILRFLELDDEPELLSMFVENKFFRGDTRGLSRETVDQKSIGGWRTGLSSPARKTLAKRYMEKIGEDDLAFQGYSKAEISRELEALKTTKDLHSLLEYFELIMSDFWALIQLGFLRRKIGGPFFS